MRKNLTTLSFALIALAGIAGFNAPASAGPTIEYSYPRAIDDGATDSVERNMSVGAGLDGKKTIRNGAAAAQSEYPTASQDGSTDSLERGGSVFAQVELSGASNSASLK